MKKNIMRNRRYNRVYLYARLEYSDTKVAHSKKKSSMSECVLQNVGMYTYCSLTDFYREECIVAYASSKNFHLFE